MNISQWLHDLQRHYRGLSVVDPNTMSDRKLAPAILDNMVEDECSQNFVSNLRKEVRDSDLQVPPMPIASVDFVTAIHEEYWYRSRRDPLINAHVFTACADADKRGSKCLHAPSNTPTGGNTKCARSNKSCSNSHCGTPHGHDASECITFGGGSQEGNTLNGGAAPGTSTYQWTSGTKPTTFPLRATQHLPNSNNPAAKSPL